jgi:hypothetical protein
MRYRKKKLPLSSVKMLSEKYRASFDKLKEICFHTIFSLEHIDPWQVEKNISECKFEWFETIPKPKWNEAIGDLISLKFEDRHILVIYKMPFDYLFDDFEFIYETEISKETSEDIVNTLPPNLILSFSKGKLISALKGNGTIEDDFDFSELL